MQGQNGDRWRTLCEQAAVEQDPSKLLELIAQINKLLYEKEQRLARQVQESAEKANAQPSSK